MIEKRTPEMGRPTIYDVKMKDTALRLRPDQTSWLLAEAARRGISKAQLVRDLIDFEMERVNGKPPRS